MTRTPFINLSLPERSYHVSYRPTDGLATRHNFASVHALAKSIPSGGRVIDVGAGLSRLGHVVTTFREDVEWVNFDTAYGDTEYNADIKRRLGQLITAAPDNLNYISGSIVNPPDELVPKQYARIFSFWMLPHLIDTSPRLGVAAAYNMLQLGEPDSILSTGPMRSYADNAQSFQVPESQAAARELAADIVGAWIYNKGSIS
jgi:hypothetical protein